MGPARQEGTAFDAVPRPSLFRVAERTPLVVLAGVVYDLAGQAQAPVEGPQMYLEGVCFPLMQSCSLAELEQDHFAVFADEIEACKRSYLEQQLQRHLDAVEELHRRLVGGEVLRFLTERLVPRLAALEQDTRAAVGQPLREEAARLVRALLRTAGQALPEVPSILPRLLGPDSLMLDGRLYRLGRAWGGLGGGRDLRVRTADGRVLRPGRGSVLLSDVEAAWSDRVACWLRRKALADAPTRARILDALEAAERLIAAHLADAPGAPAAGESYLYRGRQWGILLRRGHREWVVYREVPEYVVEDPEGLFRFDATRVGITLRDVDPVEVFEACEARVLTPGYEHPFVMGDGSICMVLPDGYFRELRSLPLEDALCLYLEDAFRVLVAGNHARNANRPYHSIDSFPRRRISRRESEQRKLPIYPYYR